MLDYKNTLFMKHYLMKGLFYMLVILSLFHLPSCKPSSYMECSWNYPSLNLTHFKKVLVVGLLGDKDDALRQDMELDLASTLNAHGMKTYSSFEKFGSISFMEKDALPALADLKDSSYDAVVCIVLLDRKKEHKYVSPSYLQYNSYNNYNNFNGAYFNAYDGFQNYYNQSYRAVYQPGYYVNSSSYTIEVIVFDFPKDSILYYAEIKSKNPRTQETLSTTVTKAIAHDMVEKKILPALKKD
jgi:hypothetical protein